MPPTKRAIIGVGNPTRTDDGVGREVVRRLSGRVPDDVELVEQSGEVSSFLEVLEHYGTVLIVDAVQADGAIGEIVTFDLSSGALPTERFSGSTHALGIEEALELARSLGTLPSKCVVMGVTGCDFSHNEGLTPELAEQLPKIEEKVLELWAETEGVCDA